MPGHIKKSEGEDPDPDPWLVVSEELRKKLNSKPYDPKKSAWVPDKATGGYDEGLIESTEGDKVTVKLLKDGQVSLISQNYSLTLQIEATSADSRLHAANIYRSFRIKVEIIS